MAMSLTIELDDVDVFATGLPHPEGVVIDADGWLYTGLSHGDHVAGGPVVRVSPDGVAVEELADTGGRVLGLAMDRRRRLYACDAANRVIARIDPDGRTETLAEEIGGWRLRLPNFCAFDSDGVLYVSDSGTATAGQPTGAVLRLAPDGRGEVLVDGLVYANGLAVDESAGCLYVVETRDDRVRRIELDTATPRAEVYASGLAHGPDGLALDNRGVLWATVTRPSRLCAITDVDRVEIAVTDLHDRRLNLPTNLAFDPAGAPEAFVANLFGDHLSRVRMPHPGRRLPHLG